MSNKDTFIGSKFDTPKGGVLTVVSKERLNGRAKYRVDCSLCSKDKELFPEYFLIDRSVLSKGVIPCGCSKAPKWAEWQYRIKVRRVCEEKGYAFKGWNGKWRGKETKLILYNPVTYNEWDTTKIQHFLNSGVGDPLEGYEKTKQSVRKDEQHHIVTFKSNPVFSEQGYIFEKIKRKDKNGHETYWEYTCPVCSEDEYTVKGLCTGKFQSHMGNLRVGKLSCRCVTNFKWTKEQREYQINKIFDHEGGYFNGWVESYKNSRSKLKWLCKNNHVCKTSVGDFLSGRRCDTCSLLNNNFGYYKDRVNEQDHLYILTSNLPYFKIGRSFDPVRRLSENQSRLNKYYGKGKYKFKQTHLLMADHSTIYNLEQLLVGFEIGMYDKDRPENTYGSSELIKMVYYDEVVKFCREYLDEWWR